MTEIMNISHITQVFAKSENSSKYYLILFIIWPFLSFVVAMSNFSQKVAKNVIFLFFIYYGLTFYISFENYTDSIHYATQLKANATRPFSDFFNIVGGIYTTDTSVDIIEPLVSFIVSRFTSNYAVYFGIWAAVFGFFYLKSIELVYKQYKKNPGWNAWVFLVFFVLILPITEINSVRMWTAAWVFFFGAYHVVLNRDKRYLLLALGASFIHFSFISANLILLIYFFAGNRNLIYFLLVIFSFVSPYVMSPVFQTMSLYLGGGVQGRFESYSNEEYISSVNQSYETANWFMGLDVQLVFYFLLFSLFFIQLFFRKKMNDSTERNLFSFLLLFLAFVNFSKVFASGGRFQVVFFLFATTYLIFYMVKNVGNKINLITLIGLFPMLLFSVLNLRTGSDSINAWIFSPGFGFPWIMKGISLTEILFP